MCLLGLQFSVTQLNFHWLPGTICSRQQDEEHNLFIKHITSPNGAGFSKRRCIYQGLIYQEFAKRRSCWIKNVHNVQTKDRTGEICVFRCQRVHTGITNHAMKHGVLYTHTVYLTRWKVSTESLESPERKRHDVDSVTEMLVAALLSGVQWWLIMSSDIAAPWRPASAALYNTLISVCVCVCVCGVGFHSRLQTGKDENCSLLDSVVFA